MRGGMAQKGKHDIIRHYIGASVYTTVLGLRKDLLWAAVQLEDSQKLECF